MTISNQCKWISFFLMSLAVILLLVMFYSFDHKKCGCENRDEFVLNETGECYPRMTKGPCHHNLIFMEDDPTGGSIYGSCNCPYMMTNRSMVFHGGVCHYVFTQAYCGEGHWLTVNRNGEPMCESNYCLQHSRNDLDLDNNANDDGEEDEKSADKFDTAYNKTDGHNHNQMNNGFEEYVPLKDRMCAQLGKTMEGCPKGAVVRFHSGYIYPSCFTPPQLSMGAIGVIANSCPLGSYRSIMGKCQPTFDFDFDAAQPDNGSPSNSQRS